MTPKRLGSFERLPQAIAEQVVRRIVEIIDVDEIVQRIDVDRVLQKIDVNGLMARVDIDGVIEQVDVNELMDKVDIDRLIERVDIDAIAARIDVEAIAERVDIDELVRRADLGPIIAQSTSGMLGEFLGLLRRQVVALDGLLDRLTYWRRRNADKPKGPVGLQGAMDRRGAETKEGQFAGGVTRLLAFFVDVVAAWGIFVLAADAVQAAVRLFGSNDYVVFHHRVVGIVAMSVWVLAYFSFQWSLSGRTIGMAILGARVVTVEGESISTKAAVIRTLILPISVVLWFVGLIEIVVRSDRRTFHDLGAGTTVVYFWEARASSIPWLQRDDALPQG